MLEIRTNCENCNKVLPPNSTEALICSFECTWCVTCNEELFYNVCPNCGGGLEKRPIRPLEKLKKYPVTLKKVFKPVDMDKFIVKREKLKNIPPELR